MVPAQPVSIRVDCYFNFFSHIESFTFVFFGAT